MFWKSQNYRDQWIKAEIKGLHKVLKEREKQAKEQYEAQKLRNAGSNEWRQQSTEERESFASKDTVQMISDRQNRTEGRTSGYTGMSITIRDVILVIAALAAIWAVFKK